LGRFVLLLIISAAWVHALKETAVSRNTVLFSLTAIVLGATALAPPNVSAFSPKDCQSLQIDSCTEILRTNPMDLIALGNRGIAFRVAGQYDLAIADLSEAIRLDPDTAGYRLERGLALEAKGEHEAAIADFDEAIARDPTLVQAHFGKAMALEATAQHEMAVASLETATRLDRNMVAALHMQRGYELSGAKRYDAAISAFESVIEIRPDWPLAYFGRGTAFEEKGDRGRAAEDYRKCIGFDANTDLVRQRQQEARQRLEEIQPR